MGAHNKSIHLNETNLNFAPNAAILMRWATSAVLRCTVFIGWIHSGKTCRFMLDTQWSLKSQTPFPVAKTRVESWKKPSLCQLSICRYLRVTRLPGAHSSVDRNIPCFAPRDAYNIKEASYDFAGLQTDLPTSQHTHTHIQRGGRQGGAESHTHTHTEV